MQCGDVMLPPIAGNEFCQEVVYNKLPPIKANLTSGVAVTGTIGCYEYQYYTMNGDAHYYYYVLNSYLWML